MKEGGWARECHNQVLGLNDRLKLCIYKVGISNIICILHGQHKGKIMIILDASRTKLASSACPCLKGKTDEKLKGLSAMDYLIPGGGGVGK